VNMVHEHMPFFDFRFLLSREPAKNLPQRLPQFLGAACKTGSSAILVGKTVAGMPL